MTYYPEGGTVIATRLLPAAISQSERVGSGAIVAADNTELLIPPVRVLKRMQRSRLRMRPYLRRIRGLQICLHPTRPRQCIQIVRHVRRVSPEPAPRARVRCKDWMAFWWLVDHVMKVLPRPNGVRSTALRTAQRGRFAAVRPHRGLCDHLATGQGRAPIRAHAELDPAPVLQTRIFMSGHQNRKFSSKNSLNPNEMRHYRTTVHAAQQGGFGESDRAVAPSRSRGRRRSWRWRCLLRASQSWRSKAHSESAIGSDAALSSIKYSYPIRHSVTA